MQKFFVMPENHYKASASSNKISLADYAVSLSAAPAGLTCWGDSALRKEPVE